MRTKCTANGRANWVDMLFSLLSLLHQWARACVCVCECAEIWFEAFQVVHNVYKDEYAYVLHEQCVRC